MVMLMTLDARFGGRRANLTTEKREKEANTGDTSGLYDIPYHNGVLRVLSTDGCIRRSC